MPTTLLAATTGADQSKPFIVASDGGRVTMPAHFTCPGIAGSETGTLQKQAADGTWSDYVINTNEHIISATRSGVVCYAPGVYRIDKSTTAAAVPVEVSTSQNP